ncbi:MAG: Carbohydrate-binding CenC domain protein [Ignavibacteria bacterium]|nr:MAG: Carbohydrate-binding CenC domain protein [Ignavibacteria bacterium]KAF0157715.1 MAG: Carbohydrate-binding CenC domain protein [Ignavibacteria bacterium]
MVLVVTNKYQSVTGFFNTLAGKRVGNIFFYPTDKEYFGSLSYIILDKERDLITLVSKTQNTNMIWNGTTTINNNWGRTPTQIYPIKLKLDLAITADSIRVYPLDTRGQESESTARTYKPFVLYHFMIDLDQTVNGTLWFGIKKYAGPFVLPGVEEAEEIPTETKLMQNYPNPFNSTTVISYKLQSASHVTLKIYDVLGREIAKLVDEYKQAGTYKATFDTRHAELSRSISSGIYFYRLTAGDPSPASEGYVQTRKLTLIR